MKNFVSTVNLTMLFVLYFLTVGHFVSAQTNNILITPTGSNYSNPENWSMLCESPDKKIDVFFVHPTTYGPPANGHYLADLTDSALNHKTDYESIFRLTAAFNEQCNIFAPRYRQMNIEVLSMPDNKLQSYIQTPKADVLAAHSQGSYILKLILQENPDLLDKEKLVAAYLPGWTFTDEDMKILGFPFGERADQTGCLMAWNTIGPGGSSPVLKSKDALCTNPLSWTTNKKHYPASMNVCAKILLDTGQDLLLENFTSAKITSSGGLKITEPDSELKSALNLSMGSHCYHLYDYDFFFYNIKENVGVRCEAYLKGL